MILAKQFSHPIQGDVIKLSMDHVPVPQRKTCIYQVVETLSQLHKLDVNKLALQDFGRSTGYCGRVVGCVCVHEIVW